MKTTKKFSPASSKSFFNLGKTDAVDFEKPRCFDLLSCFCFIIVFQLVNLNHDFISKYM